MENITSITRRDVIGAAGVTLVAGTGAVAAATEECPPCDDPDAVDRFCLEDCVVTVDRVRGFDDCPFHEPTRAIEIPAGVPGIVVERCQRDCDQAVLVDFCGELWWVRSVYLDRAPDEECDC